MKLILTLFVIFVLFTIGSNVYERRAEICTEEPAVIAAEEAPKPEVTTPDEGKSEQFLDKAKTIYNNGIEKSTKSVIEAVRKVKCKKENSNNEIIKE